MPYKIRKLPLKNLYRVYNADTGEIHAKATTLENAKKQVKLLHMVDAGVPLRQGSGTSASTQARQQILDIINEIQNMTDEQLQQQFNYYNQLDNNQVFTLEPLDRIRYDRIIRELNRREELTARTTGTNGSGLKNEIPNKKQELSKYSDINRVMKNAERYFKHDFTIAPSTRKTKKFMVLNPHTNKWVHFGQMGMQDFTFTQNKDKQKSYLARATNIKGNWKSDKYSANNLAINLLWK